MKATAKAKTAPAEEKADPVRELRHDVKNQLSNIFLALEQLRYEIPDASEDCLFYLDAIFLSTTKINSLLQDKA